MYADSAYPVLFLAYLPFSGPALAIEEVSLKKNSFHR